MNSTDHKKLRKYIQNLMDTTANELAEKVRLKISNDFSKDRVETVNVDITYNFIFDNYKQLK